MTDAVASATTSAAATSNINAGQASLNESYTTFLTLLTTQLKNQDPTSPMDTNAFTQQLVAMTGVQQQLLTNELLQGISNNSSNSGVAGSVGLIGKTATATSSDATLANGAANWTYNLAGDASAATLTITDSTGKAVYSTAGSNLAAGNHTLSWNGKNFAGVQLPDGGVYTLSIAAADSSGNSVASTSSVTGSVGSVTQANGTTLVKIGVNSVPLSSITSVTNP
jgi:flagellar basal-body rod modification protein FlgD